MIWVQIGGEVLRWSAWLWEHREKLEPALKKLGAAGDVAQRLLANPDGTLRRVGNTLIFGQADGGGKVLGFVEQTSRRVEAIEQAVGGLHAKTDLLASSLNSLHTISMVTLGLSALTPAILGFQFAALNRRLGALQRQIADLQKKFNA